MAKNIIELDTSQLEKLGKAMRTAAPSIINAAWKTLSAWGAEYHRRVQRVTPVGPTTEDRIGGTAKQSWQLIRDKGNLMVTIGSSVKSEDGKPYLTYLEYGTERIAGGRVKAWQPGQSPIMEWPAKLQGLGNFHLEKNKGREMGVGREGSAKFERHVNLSIKAFTAGQGEQMPMLRPIGYEIAPQVVADVSNAVKEEIIEQIIHKVARD